jgi:hypothetical protein
LFIKKQVKNEQSKLGIVTKAAGNLPVFKDSGTAFGQFCLPKPTLPCGVRPKGKNCVGLLQKRIFYIIMAIIMCKNKEQSRYAGTQTGFL